MLGVVRDVGRTRTRFNRRGFDPLPSLAVALLLGMGVLVQANLALATQSANTRATVSIENSTSDWGCQHLGTSVAPSFTARLFQYSGLATAHTCRSSSSPNATVSHAQWDMGVSENRTVSFGSTGAHWVNVTWKLDWAIDTQAFVQRNCSGTPPSPISYAFLNCQATSGVDVEDFAYLVDLTNGTYYYPLQNYQGATNFSGLELDQACYLTCTNYPVWHGANNSTHAAGTERLDIPILSVNPTHKYALFTGVEGQILLIVKTSSFNFTNVVRLLGGASGKIDMASPRHGATLLHIVIS